MARRYGGNEEAIARSILDICPARGSSWDDREGVKGL